MNFKEILKDDIGEVFIDPGEFGSEHTWNGISIVCIVEDFDFDSSGSNNGTGGESYYKDKKNIFIEKSLIEKPIITEDVEFDDSLYIILGVIEDDGMLEINIERKSSW